MAKLSHPNVVPIYEVGEHGDRVFVAMELVAGETLTAWHRRATRDWREVLEKYVAAGRGLAAAHAQGIVHRDFKPDNVLVGTDGRPRVLDFGLARGINAPSDDGEVSASILDVNLTAAGTMMGTPTYMSPEHFRGEGIGPASDQFCFAVAVYRGLFGEAPFAGESLAELRTSVCGGALRSPPSLGDTPPGVVDAVVRALSVAPGDRFPTIDALLAELERPLHIDPDRDLTRARGGRRIAAAVISLSSLAVLVGIATVDEMQMLSAPRIVLQAVIALVALSIIGVFARKSLASSAHNRRVGVVIIASCAGLVVHRVAALYTGAAPIDTLIGDAVMLGVVTVIAGAVLERWMIFGGVLAMIYVAAALAIPNHAGFAFGVLILLYGAAAAWRWREPTRPWHKGGAITSSAPKTVKL